MVKRIAFYSPIGGAHTTTTALLMGLFLAEEYKTPTLIIDFNMVSPTIHLYLSSLNKNSANSYVSYLAGRLVGEVAHYPLSKRLFVIPATVDPTAASRMAYTLGYTLGKTDEPIRRSLANLIDGIISDAIKTTGAKIVLIDTESGMSPITRLILRYLADDMILLCKADSVSRRRCIEIVTKMKRIGDLRLGIGRHYKSSVFIISNIPLIFREDVKSQRIGCNDSFVKILDPYILKTVSSAAKEVSSIGISKTYIEPLLPQLTVLNTSDAVKAVWENKNKTPYCFLANTIRGLARLIKTM